MDAINIIKELPEITYDQESKLFYFTDFDLFKLLRGPEHCLAAQSLTLSETPNN